MNRETITDPVTRRRFLSLTAMAAAVTACGVPDSAGTGGGKLKAATYIPPSYKDLFPPFQMFMETAKKESGGDLVFDLFHSETLLSADQLVPGLLQGVADAVFQVSSYVSSSYPVLGVYEMPFVNNDIAQTERALEVGGPLYDMINKELGAKGLRLIGSMLTTEEWIWTMEKPIRKPSDMEGLRIRTAGEVEGETVKALGGSPVSMSSSEVYQALERGTIDGMISYTGTVISRDLQEIIRYGTVGHFGHYGVDTYVRKEWFDGLDSAAQEALLAAGRKYWKDGTAHQHQVIEQSYLPKIDQAGIELFEPTGAELKAFEQATTGVYDWWRNRVGSTALADRALNLVQTA
ncbi:MAG: TRAP transporter substrate-binding protein [Nocardioidaceae bacterium]